jgi:hypothetical protein
VPAHETKAAQKETKLSIRVDQETRDRAHIVARAHGQSMQEWLGSLVHQEIGRYDFSGLVSSEQVAATN